MLVQEPSAVSLGAYMGPTSLTGAAIGDRLCVWADRGDGRRLPVILPTGYSVRLDPDLEVTDDSGVIVAIAGQLVWLGGGMVPLTTASREKVGRCVVGEDVYLVGHNGIMPSPPPIVED